jgi:hypothetical protein
MFREYQSRKYHSTVDLQFDWFGLVCFANKNKFVSSHTADSKPMKQEVYGTIILPPLVFPDMSIPIPYAAMGSLGFCMDKL